MRDQGVYRSHEPKGLEPLGMLALRLICHSCYLVDSKSVIIVIDLFQI